MVGLQNYPENFANPVFTLNREGAWQPLGEAPAEWKGAYIPNHFVMVGDDLYAGVGGERGTLSVWKFAGTTWSKVAGDGLYGSWQDPLADEGLCGVGLSHERPQRQALRRPLPVTAVRSPKSGK